MNTMLEHFRDGGWGMFPTMIFGLLLLLVSVRYAIDPAKRWVPLVVGLSALTLSSGALGFVTGVIVTGRAVAEAADVPMRLSFVGVGESLNNVAFALIFTTLAALSVSFGAFRVARHATEA